MKNSYFSIVLLLVSLSLSAQHKSSEQKSSGLGYESINAINATASATATQQLDSIYLDAPYNEAGDLVTYSNYKYQYNDIGKIGEMEAWYLYYLDQPMYPLRKLQYSYAADGLLEFIMEYEGDGNAWVLGSKYFYSYNADNSLKEIIKDYQDYDTKEWIPFTRQEFSYDDNGNLINMLQWYKGSYNPEFKLDEKTDYVYDSENRLSERKDYWYDNDTWIGKTGKTYHYNADGQVEKVDGLRYNEVLFTWNSLSYHTYTYDAAGNETKREEMSIMSGSEMTLTEIVEYTYDTQNSLSNTAFPAELKDEIHRSQPDYFENVPLSENKTTNMGDGWEQGTIAAYYYSEFKGVLSGIELRSDKSFSLYPNPATDILHVGNAEVLPHTKVNIYSLNGALLHSYELNDSKSIDISALEMGVYLIELQSDAERYRAQKLIVN